MFARIVEIVLSVGTDWRQIDVAPRYHVATAEELMASPYLVGSKLFQSEGTKLGGFGFEKMRRFRQIDPGSQPRREGKTIQFVWVHSVCP